MMDTEALSYEIMISKADGQWNLYPGDEVVGLLLLCDCV